MRAVLRDARDVVRNWTRTPLVTAISIASLALGIGANTAIFSALNALLLRPLPGTSPERVVRIIEEGRPLADARVLTSAWEHIRGHQDVFDVVAAYARYTVDASAAGQAAQQLAVEFVSGSYFGVIDIPPAVGRLLAPDDDRPESVPVVVLSHSYWERQFAGDPSVVGRIIYLERQPVEIIGVAPPAYLGMEVGRRIDAVVPIASYDRFFVGAGEQSASSRSYWLTVVGRIRSSQPIEQAVAAVRSLQVSTREASLPGPSQRGQYLTRPWSLEPVDQNQTAARRTLRSPLFILTGISVLVLVIACANVANLMLAQASARRHEMAVRLSLGSSRGQLVRQFVTESVLLAVCGIAAGRLFGLAASRGLTTLLAATRNAFVLDVSPDWRVFGFTAAVGLTTALIAGIVPAWRTTRLDPIEALRQRTRGVVPGAARFSMAQALLGLQVAFSFVLVLAAGAFVGTFVSLTTSSLGFERDRAFSAGVSLRRVGVEEGTRNETVTRVLNALQQSPGVEDAAFALVPPFGGGSYVTNVTVEGYTPTSETDSRVNYATTSAGYFRTLGIPMVAGSGREHAAGRTDAVIVNLPFARKFFGRDDVVGQTFQMPNQGKPARFEITAVVAETKFMSLRVAAPMIFLPWHASARMNSAYFTFIVRSRLPYLELQQRIVSEVERIAPGASIAVSSLDRDALETIVIERTVAAVAAVFAMVALLLAAIGLYGVVANHVARRRHEIGIRMAVGATPGRVLHMVLGQVALIVVIGIVVGTALSAGLHRLVATFLYGLGAQPLFPASVALMILVMVTLIAGFIPARRAASLDPLLALREE